MSVAAPPRPRPQVAHPPPSAPTPSTGRRIVGVEIVIAAALPIAALTALRGLYADWSYAAAGLGAVGVVAGLGVVLHRRRVRALASGLVLGLAGVLYTAYSTLSDTMAAGIPTADTIGGLVDALVGGWSSTLDSLLPIPVASDTTVLATGAVWLAAAVGVELVRRSRSVLAPTLPALVLFAATMPLTASTDWSTLLQAGALVGGTLLFVLTRASPEFLLQQAPESRTLEDAPPRVAVSARLRAGIPVVVICALVGPLVALALTDRGVTDPFDPRQLRTEAVRLTDVVNPLVELKAQLALDPPEPLVTLELPDPDQASLVDRLAIVPLEVYDGATWSTTAGYEQRGSDLGDDSELDVGAERVEQRITLTGLPAPWLPAAVHPIEVSAPDVLYSRTSGALIRSDAFEADEYTVTSLIAQPTPTELDAAPLDLSGETAVYTELPATAPPELADLAEELMGEGTPAQQLRNLESALRSFPYDPAVASGTSIGRLERFLLDDGRGLSEQHAAAFAVLARTQGFPTRLVVGLRTTTTGVDGVAAPLEDLTTAQYHVWPEVRFVGVGWVPFEPTPAETTSTPGPAPAAPETEGRLVGQQQTPLPEGPTEEPPSEETTTSGEARTVRTAVVVGLALVVLALVYVAIVLVAKAVRRRRRRRAATPAAQIVGAWRETTDRLYEAGIRTAPGMTLAEIARAGGPVLAPASDNGDSPGEDPPGDEPEHPATALDAMVPDVHLALYGAVQPPEAVVASMWGLESDVRHQLARARGPLARLRARLDPRPLVARS